MTARRGIHVPIEATPRTVPIVPVACPIGRSTPGTCGHSRTARYADSPANGQADLLRKPAFSATGQSLSPSELHGVRIVAVSRLAEWTIDRAATRRAGDTPPLAPCAWPRLLLPRSAAGWS